MDFPAERINIQLPRPLSRDDWSEMEKFWPPHLKQIELKASPSADFDLWPPNFIHLKPYGDDNWYDNPFRTFRKIMVQTNPGSTSVRPIPK